MSGGGLPFFGLAEADWISRPVRDVLASGGEQTNAGAAVRVRRRAMLDLQAVRGAPFVTSVGAVQVHLN
jgi:hypothetical protein